MSAVVARWARDLALGVRLALTGAPLRTALTAMGVAFGVALLLAGASVPSLMDARNDRTSARDDDPIPAPQLARGETTLRIAVANTEVRSEGIRGRVVQAEGPRAPVPPGVARLPGPGEIVVSPALRELLAGPDGTRLRARLGDPRVVGTIGRAGLDGPREPAFYLGSDRLAAQPVGPIRRIDRFGSVSPEDGLDPALLFLVAIGIVACLVPIVIFIATAVRFGGEERDRRLAALRLVGADSAMARRIAAGESLLAALAGLVAGAGIFLVARTGLDALTIFDLSVYGTDLVPTPVLGAVAVTLVPLTAVAVTLVALRSVVIEPLGVTRRAQPVRRRLWWRVLPPLLGAALLIPADLDDGGTRELVQGGLGATLVLIGIATLLPWAVEALVARIPGRTVPLQLAVRRLQLDNTAASQVVSGIAVAVAAAIALHTLYAATEDDYTTTAGVEGGRTWLNVFPDRTRSEDAETFAARLSRVEGVQDQAAYGQLSASTADGNPVGLVEVVSCATVRRIAVVERCRDGDAFLQPGDDPGVTLEPGARVVLGDPAPDGSTKGLPRWTVPRDIPTARARERQAGVVRAAFEWAPGAVLATPGALPRAALEQQRVVAWVAADEGRPAVEDRVRDAVAETGPLAIVENMTGGTRVSDDFASVRLALLGGTVAVLGLIGVSLLVTLLEQLRERRRALAALLAFGTRRSTLGWSVLWQTALPVGAGLVLAIAGGSALGLLLLAMAGEPLALDLPIIGLLTAAAAAVVLAVTALSLPVLWRLMRVEGLRTE